MTAVLTQETPVLIQGITGRTALFHAGAMRDYGTSVVGGVVPGKGGETAAGVPVFNTMKEAVAKTGASASMVMVPAPFAADAIMEAADAGITLCVAVTDGIPAQDMMRVKRYMRRYRADRRMRLFGPNGSGIIVPGEALLGIMPHEVYQPGSIGVVTRSGTLGYEAAEQLSEMGLGVSTSIGIGGDPINGSSFRDILKLFEEDAGTELVLMIAEIGGPQEAAAAAYIKETMTKPVVACVVGQSAPRGRRMGHAGAIISAFGESAPEKVEILTGAGVIVTPDAATIGETVAAVLAKSKD